MAVGRKSCCGWKAGRLVLQREDRSVAHTDPTDQGRAFYPACSNWLPSSMALPVGKPPEAAHALFKDVLSFLFSGPTGLKINWHFWINKKFLAGLTGLHFFIPVSELQQFPELVRSISLRQGLHHPSAPFRIGRGGSTHISPTRKNKPQPGYPSHL